MQSEVMFAGFGGQGILLSAKILAHAAMEEGREVAWVPSYGPEMRGGTAYCTVVVSDRLIGSPIIRNPMHLVAMNRPSLEKFAAQVKPGGVILINSSLIDIGSGRSDVDELRVPVNDIAVTTWQCAVGQHSRSGRICRPQQNCRRRHAARLRRSRVFQKEKTDSSEHGGRGRRLQGGGLRPFSPLSRLSSPAV